MISAFGVEHSEISKTYVGGGAYRSITSLSPKARKVIRTKIVSNKEINDELPKSLGLTRTYEAALGRSKQQRNAMGTKVASRIRTETMTKPYDAIPTKKTPVRGLTISADATPEQVATAVRAAGKKKLKRPASIKFIREENAILPKGKQGVHRPGAPGVPARIGIREGSKEKTYAHELAHSQTKRKHGFQYRPRPNRSIAREEARADVFSGYDRRTGASPEYTKMFERLKAKGVGLRD